MIHYIKHIIDKYPLLEDYINNLKECDQDSIFHPEGNVYTHTLMVLEEINKLELPKEDKDILLLTGLLHDIGKPYCSKLEEGHIRSHGHSRIGYHIANELLSKSLVDFNDKLTIINLIKYHGEPNWIASRENPEYDVIKMSQDVRLDLLYYLAKSDFLGRTAADKDDQILNIEIFKEYAESLSCFGNPFIFNSDLVKFNYLVKKNMHYSDVCYDDTKSKVILMSGLPGSGKDTYISKNFKDYAVISLDQIRKDKGLKPDAVGQVINDAKEMARVYLRKGENFVWNATNINKDIREGLISLFNTYNAHITIVYITTPYNLVIERNKMREAEVPEAVIEKMLKKFDIPMIFEVHDVIYV